ncbi:MAG TPA: hypothetical protein VFI25_14860 [Planctomycetota bacterium]|jgi:hypothetical protein|nr:hypothetical protein [Planctomycetota bacterium]
MHPILLFPMLLAAPGAQEKPPSPLVRSQSVTGEAVDLACRLFPRPGGAHACAAECLARGVFPAVIDEASGKAWLVFEKDRRPAGERLAAHAGGRVRLTGKTHEGRGVRAVVLDGIAKAEGEKAASAPAPGEPERARETTLLASVVSVLDQVEASAKGQKHACSAKCAQGGALLGLLDLESGRLYLAFTPERKDARPLLEPYAGLKVRASGRVSGVAIELVRVEKG